MTRLTSAQRAVPGQRNEATKRLAAIAACAEHDWQAIDEAGSYPAQLIRVTNVDPDWALHPLGERRYTRLGYCRSKP